MSIIDHLRLIRQPALAALVVAGAAFATRGGAQSVQRVIAGSIVDVRDNPLAFVTIVVRGDTKSTATTNDSGRFVLVIPHRNRVVFEAKRLGFMPSQFTLTAGGDTTVSILLLPATTQLPKVEVKDVAPKPIGLAGFERRMMERKRGAGAGWFVTAKDIEASNPLRSTQVVDAIPSIVVRRESGDRFAIYGRTGIGQECPATVYLDGVIIGGISDIAVARDRRGRPIVVKGEEGAPIDMLVEPSEIAGVEVYQRGIFAPNSLQPNDPNAMRCAIVAFWTKHAG